MSSIFQLSLDLLCNSKIIRVNNIEKENYGIDNYFITNMYCYDDKRYICDGIEFALSKSKYDNIVCAGQKIAINQHGRFLHLLGFAYWGASSDIIKVLYEKKQAKINIAFPDWAKETWVGARDAHYYRNLKISTHEAYTISNGMENVKGYFHHLILDIDDTEKIKEIELPNNMFIHIFGITIEK